MQENKGLDLEFQIEY